MISTAYNIAHTQDCLHTPITTHEKENTMPSLIMPDAISNVPN